MQPTLIPHAVAALLGVGAARADERYRPMSRALLALLGARSVLEVSRLFRPDRAERKAAYVAGLLLAPYEGIARASWAVEQVAVVTWYAVLSWAVWRALEGARSGRSQTSDVSPGFRLTPDGIAVDRSAASDRARSTCLALAFLASSALLFFLYPVVRGRPVELASVVVFCSALAAQLAAATRYIHRWRRPDAAQGVALVLVAGSVADAAGPWLFSHPSLDWKAGEPVGVLIWGVIAGAEIWTIVKRRTR
jgi:hypothetical protein